MIFTKESAHQQIKELVKVQSGLHIESENKAQIELIGEISVNCKSKGYVLSDNYPVQIVIPLDSDKLPYVIDTGNRILKDYPHFLLVSVGMVYKVSWKPIRTFFKKKILSKFLH